MFNTLYVLSGYNNYINRKLKFEDTINEYLEFDNMIFTGVNFNPSDEINTEVTLNFSDYATADYVIVADQAGQNIISRWFIIDRVRVRGNQWNFTLRRDVVADYWNVVKSSPCFIEKATLNKEDPRIFNSENMNFNQIKTNEYLLKDKSKCAWIVGYYAANSTIPVGTVPNNNPLDIPFIQLDRPIEEWNFYNNSNLSPNQTPLKSSYSYEYQYYIRDNFRDSGYYIVSVNAQTQESRESSGSGLAVASSLSVRNTNLTNSAPRIKEAIQWAQIQTADKVNINEGIESYIGTNNAAANTLSALNGQIIRDINGKVYKIKVVTATTGARTVDITAGVLYQNLSLVISAATANNSVTGSPNNKTFKVNVLSTTDYTVVLTEMSFQELTYDMTAAKLNTLDAPYNIFAIPYGKIEAYSLINGVEQTLCTTSEEIAINTAMAIQKANPAIVYDIQILPYCPTQELLSDNEIYFTSTDQYSVIKFGEDEIKGIILNIPNARFSFNIEYEIPSAATAIERKINSECDKWRLCSPNYSSYFDFNNEMNDGIRYFNIDCEYKPYTPYIHINPNFNYLYGQDFNDPRGLVCGGDFSLAQIIDQWQQYQIQNKNFQNIFDRQIQNMEITNKYQRELDITSAIAGTLQGGVSGAATGMMASGGNPYAAIAGAVVGTAASAVAGARDVQINQALRNEAIDFTRDNFGYQLGNIQALPNTISKVSAFNNNNKLFPVLEYYTCTEVEKEALRNKIKYNGMTVMTIGKIEDYITYDTSYIKGQLIQLPLINDDFHVANTIVGEVNKGLYIEGGYLNG